MIRNVLLLTLILTACGQAHAETTPPRCIEITSLPIAPITTAGVYCLTQDLSTGMSSGQAITINANNVTLDCNDHKIGGSAAGAGTQTIGVYGPRDNLTVRNCNVRGFRTGILLFGNGAAVEDNRLDGNTVYGVLVAGNGGVVRRNRIFDTGDNTDKETPSGIYTLLDVDVLNNTVANVTATPGSNDPAYGIRTAQNSSGAIGDNHVRNILADGSAASAGIRNEENGRISIYRNRVSNPGTNGYGVICHFNGGPAIASDNHINGFGLSPSALPFCFNGGHNVAQ